MNEKETLFDHVPTLAELEGVAHQQERNDPRSLLYERVLMRPKIPFWKLLLCFLLSTGVCLGVYFGVLHITCGNSILAVVSAVITAVVICLVFAKRILIMLVKIYQRVASDQLRMRCRYEPSCSVYMLMALEKYGVRVGLKKGLKRWRSCKPPNGGIDLP